jgi:hypothetical protein
MWRFLTVRSTHSDHDVPTSRRPVGYSTGAWDLVYTAWSKSRINHLGWSAMLGLPLRSRNLNLADHLSATGRAQVALTVMRPKRHQSGACHDDVIAQWSTATA